MGSAEAAPPGTHLSLRDPTTLTVPMEAALMAFPAKAALLAFVLLALSVAGADAQLPSSVVTDGIGVSDHPYFTDSKLDMEQAAGVKFLRTDITWTDVEQTKGIYDFSSYTALTPLRGARHSHGLRPGLR